MQKMSLTVAEGRDRHVGLVNSPTKLGETEGNNNLKPEPNLLTTNSLIIN